MLQTLLIKKLSTAAKKYEKITGNKDFYKLFCCPGRCSGYLDEFTGEKLTKAKLLKRIMDDNPNIKRLTKNQKCPDGYYKVAFIVDKAGTDYHFYRQDSNGFWSHKNGCQKVTNKDGKGKLITDPEKAYIKNSHTVIFCGYLAVPNLRKYKNISNITKKTRGTVSGAQQIYEKILNKIDG